MVFAMVCDSQSNNGGFCIIGRLYPIFNRKRSMEWPACEINIKKPENQNQNFSVIFCHFFCTWVTSLKRNTNMHSKKVWHYFLWENHKSKTVDRGGIRVEIRKIVRENWDWNHQAIVKNHRNTCIYFTISFLFMVKGENYFLFFLKRSIFLFSFPLVLPLQFETFYLLSIAHCTINE